MSEELLDKLKVSECDYFIYTGPIDRSGYEELTNALDTSGRQEKCAIFLATYGGDPDAAYRIGRALGHYYEHVTCVVSDMCKSAGTLIAIAAHELVIFDRGELGPLDVQVNKPDEMFERSSGLDITSGVVNLRNEALEAFRKYVVDIKIGGQVSTKLASEVATGLARGLIEPIASQIDPVRIGEHRRAMEIALEYGRRLNDKFCNLKSTSSLGDLISGYPSHSFVIDRKEANTLFNNVRVPNDEETELETAIRDQLKVLIGKSASNFVWINQREQSNEEAESGETSGEKTEEPIDTPETKQESGKGREDSDKSTKRPRRKKSSP